jgi:hypothetical protein
MEINMQRVAHARKQPAMTVVITKGNGVGMGVARTWSGWRGE